MGSQRRAMNSAEAKETEHLPTGDNVQASPQAESEFSKQTRPMKGQRSKELDEKDLELPCDSLSPRLLWEPLAAQM